MESKICTKCKIEKDITEYYTNKSKPISRCKECTKDKANYYRKSNIELNKERKRKYYQDNKEHCSLKNKKYREENIKSF